MGVSSLTLIIDCVTVNLGLKKLIRPLKILSDWINHPADVFGGPYLNVFCWPGHISVQGARVFER